jgi:hypothetical protein
MYANMYAQSTASTTGGFVGDQPSADPTALQNARADIRGRIEQKVRESAASSTATIVLPDLIQFAYDDLPPVQDQNNTVKIAEVAHVSIPQFDAQTLAQTIARGVGTDTEGTPLSFVPGKGFAAANLNATSSALGNDPLQFTLSGNATLIWQVDAKALAQALAGHDQAAFSTIESGFPGVQEAHARIEPFWKTSFPTNPADIKVIVTNPAAAQ